MSKKGTIDLEKISSSAETLSSIENVINVVDLSSNFADIEKILRQINFEHANCMNYKEPMELIYSDLERIKRKINVLAEALRRTKTNYSKINSFSEEDIKEFRDIYKETPASEDLSKLVGDVKQGDFTSIAKSMTTDLPEDNNHVTSIPLPEDENVSSVPMPDPVVEEKGPIDTLPIGIAIGATGIAGSIGAVVVDDIYSKKEKQNRRIDKSDIYIDEYEENNALEDSDAYYASKKLKEESMGVVQGPYRAARFEREADRYYGSQLQKWDLADDGNEYVDEDDDYLE